MYKHIYPQIRSKAKAAYHLSQATHHVTAALNSVMWSSEERQHLHDLVGILAKFMRKNEHKPWYKMGEDN